jgi:glycosyltransferase involved in cell wall biosynthesis
MHTHLGVRNVILSVYNALIRDHDCDLIIPAIDAPNNIRFKRVILSPAFLRDGGFWTDSYFEFRSPNEFYKHRNTPITEIVTRRTALDDVVFNEIGSKLEEQLYDLAIFSVPWLSLPRFGKFAPLNVGIVYDMIPNLYAFTKGANDFAFRHAVGYSHYIAECDGIWCISEATKENFIRYQQAGSEQAKVTVIKPLTPTFLNREAITQTEKLGGKGGAEKTIVYIPNIFDERKGIGYLSKLIKETERSALQTCCFIFSGEERCRSDVMHDFVQAFDGLDCRVYKKLSSQTLIKVYQQARLTFFPSKNEGLGLPVIESQFLGTPVLSGNFETVHEVCTSPSLIISMDADSDRRLLLEWLRSAKPSNDFGAFRELHLIENLAGCLNRLIASY